MIILRRIVFLLTLVVVGVALIPALIFGGNEGISWLMDGVDKVANWAGLD